MTEESNQIEYWSMHPAEEIGHLVESFWMLTNKSGKPLAVTVLPDGRIDASFSFGDRQGIVLLGLESGPSRAEIPPDFTLFSISFRPLAATYLFKDFLPILPDSATVLPAGFFGVPLDGFQDIEQFCAKLTENIAGMVKKSIDARKKKLFDLIYATHGSISVGELSEKTFWTSRQINRYFRDTIGISLKNYCNIIRFRASFQHIREGRLFPDENYADQSHFIREIKKYAGVVPKELARNKNDRFIQFSTLPPA
ncbi:helix-turn-helix domain-containing protein [Dyadobacter jiangsuensis]